jgi:hypothetical protein
VDESIQAVTELVMLAAELIEPQLPGWERDL